MADYNPPYMQIPIIPGQDIELFINYLSSLELLPSTCRATINCWICCVPS